MKVWIHINGIQEGPYELGELPLNRIKPDTPVWYEGLDYWKEASQAPEVAGYMARMAAETADRQASEPKTQPEPAPAPEPEATPASEPAAASEPEPAATPEPEPAAVSEPEPAATLEPEPEADSEPETGSGPETYDNYGQQTDGWHHPYGRQGYNQVYSQQGGYNREEENESPTYLVWAILLTLLCCNPLGIIAIITAVITGRRNSNYDYAGAKRMSEATAWWIMIVMVTSLIMAPFMSIIMA